MRELRRFRDKRKRNEPGETMGFILELSELAKMIDSLFDRFNMAEEHRTGASFTHAMPDPVHLFPFVSGFFPSTGLIPNNRIEYFCASTSPCVKTGPEQTFERVLNGKIKEPICEVPDFDR